MTLKGHQRSPRVVKRVRKRPLESEQGAPRQVDGIKEAVKSLKGLLEVPTEAPKVLMSLQSEQKELTKRPQSESKRDSFGDPGKT